ncbi:uncharacterized protein [Chiloscyllium punctatum]|uniref:uncharacterized protein n=1 Tax=Chiloscyllium punctatum TaxID=137246 RepID=UPI003B63CF87
MKIILFLFAAAQIFYQSDSQSLCEPTTITVIDSVLNVTTARVNTLFTMGNPLSIVNCRITNINEIGSFIIKLDLAFDVQEAASSIAPGMNLSSAINLTCTSQVIIENTTIDIVSLVCNSTSTNSTLEPSATPTPGPTSTPETTPMSTLEPMTTPTPEPTPTPETTPTSTPEPMTTPTPETTPTSTPEPMTTPTPETTPTSTPEPMTTPTPEPMTSTKRKPPSSSESNESIDSNESSESNESSDSNES